MKIGKNWQALAVLVAAGRTIKDAAAELGMADRSAYRISVDPEFVRTVCEIRTELAAAAVGQLTKAASEAVSTLASLLDAGYEPSVRLQAAKAILGLLPSISEHGELRARIDKLENSRERS